MSSSRPVLRLLAAGLALATSACGPKPSIQVGVRDYNTDVVYGEKKRPLPLPPIPGAEPAPLFPPPIIELPAPPPPSSFFSPSSPNAAPPPTKPPPACPDARISQIPPPTEAELKGKPPFGAYPYRVSVTRRSGDKTEKYAITEWRTWKEASASGLGAGAAWDVVVKSGRDVYTTRYEVKRPVGSGSLDGIYITSVVKQPPTGGAEVFQPSDLGLRIFALPADLGVSWSSAATDPLRQTSVRISATASERFRVNVCGKLVEGWNVVASIDKVRGAEQVHTDTTFVVVPQMGGLIVADSNVTATETVDATINTLTPTAKAP